VGVSVGPIGREAAASVTMGRRGYAMVYSYSCSIGAFMGISIDGTVTHTRSNANLAFYGRPLTAKDLLLGGCVEAPPAARALYNALDSMTNSFAYSELQRLPNLGSMPMHSQIDASAADHSVLDLGDMAAEKGAFSGAERRSIDEESGISTRDMAHSMVHVEVGPSPSAPSPPPSTIGVSSMAASPVPRLDNNIPSDQSSDDEPCFEGLFD
jgi:hypothetical protein